jgi:hypothetical protein
MKIYGYADEGLEPEETKLSELAEITLVANPNELCLIAQPVGWADEGSPSFAIDGLRTSAHPTIYEPNRIAR